MTIQGALPHYKTSRARGVSLPEVLVSISLFGIVTAIVANALIPSLRRMSLDSRMSEATGNLRNGVATLLAELRMSNSVAPYLLRTDTEGIGCSQNLKIDTDGKSMRFFTSHDSSSGSQGREIYYVGYRYDATKKMMYRGEVTMPDDLCDPTTAPSDPLSTANAAPMVKNIIPQPGEMVFSQDNSLVQVKYLIEVTFAGVTAQQSFESAAFIRAM